MPSAMNASANAARPRARPRATARGRRRCTCPARGTAGHGSRTPATCRAAARRAAPQLEHVPRELEVEERALPLLVLRRRRQHVVAWRAVSVRATSITTRSSSAAARRHALAVGQRVGGVGGLDSIARKRSGWSARISSGITLQGTSPVTSRWPRDRRDRLGIVRARAAAAGQRCDPGVQVHAAGNAEVAGEQHDNFSR